MTLRNLHYLIAVAERRGFVRASERCCISQPTPGTRIKKMEADPGMRIFECANKKVPPTGLGERLIASARRLLKQADTIKEPAATAQDPLAGNLRLDAFPRFSTYLIGPRMNRPVLTAFGIALLSVLLCRQTLGATLHVGPQRALKMPSEAAKIAKDGDVVAIDAGVYVDDAASWRQHGLTLRGMGGRAHLDSGGKTVEGKAIWVLKGNGISVENIEFSGAKVAALNGAGIRFEGTRLSIRNCHFHNNEMGLLAGANARSDILIEGSEFNDNTVDYRRYGKLGHNIYIGNIRRFTLRNSYIHDAETGHNVKSRARENYILYNRIMDEHHASSYLVDLPDGGNAYLIGNLFHQSAGAENISLLAFAAEHNRDKPDQALYAVNNTIVNDRDQGIFVKNHSIGTAHLINNLIVGELTLLAGPGALKQNMRLEHTALQNMANYDYRLSPASIAIDRGIDPGHAANGFALTPEYQYRHPVRREARRKLGPIDIGAYEFSSYPAGRR